MLFITIPFQPHPSPAWERLLPLPDIGSSREISYLALVIITATLHMPPNSIFSDAVLMDGIFRRCWVERTNGDTVLIMECVGGCYVLLMFPEFVTQLGHCVGRLWSF